MTAPGQGKSIRLFAVRFDDKVTSADSGGDLAALEVTIPPRTWSSRGAARSFEGLERTYGVKL